VNAQSRVSVILPVKNGERFLREALESVVAQTYQPHEILVIDGNSTDSSAEIARSFAGVEVIPQPDSGLYQAFNLGVRRATGDLIAFIGSDDVWLPDKLRFQVEFLEANPSVQMVIGQVQFFLEPGYDFPQGFKPELLDHEIEGHMPEVVLVRRSVFDLNGLFDDSFALAGDVDWFTRNKDAGITPRVLPNLLTRKRLHDSNLMAGAERNNRELLRIMRRSVERQRQFTTTSPDAASNE
jgi:glycosyltransferase involved in cell wall biosynthesis